MPPPIIAKGSEGPTQNTTYTTSVRVKFINTTMSNDHGHESEPNSRSPRPFRQYSLRSYSQLASNSILSETPKSTDDKALPFTSTLGQIFLLMKELITQNTETRNTVNLAIFDVVTRLESVNQNLQKIAENTNTMITSIPTETPESLTTKITELATAINTLSDKHPNPVIENNPTRLDKIIALNERLLTDKKQEVINRKCIDIKRSLKSTWSNILNQRKQHFWNFLKNHHKAELYKEWSNQFPNFIPMKYRAKYITNESPSAQKVRIEKSREKYHSDIPLMMVYAESHKAKYEKADDEISALINGRATEEEKHVILNWWQSDIQREETISLDKWNHHLNFLTRKREEEMDNIEQHMLTSTTHEEHQALKKKHFSTKHNSTNNYSHGNTRLQNNISKTKLPNHQPHHSYNSTTFNHDTPDLTSQIAHISTPTTPVRSNPQATQRMGFSLPRQQSGLRAAGEFNRYSLPSFQPPFNREFPESPYQIPPMPSIRSPPFPNQFNHSNIPQSSLFMTEHRNQQINNIPIQNHSSPTLPTHFLQTNFHPQHST